MRLRRWAALALGLFPLACGGKNEGPRPAPNYCRPILPVSDSPDPGSGPIDCHALDGYELYTLDTFEPGHQFTGWYVNTDRTALSDPPPDEEQPPHSTEIPNGRCIGVTPTADQPTNCATLDAPRGSCSDPFSMESRWAIHITTGLMTNNGGLLGMDFPLKCCDPNNPGDPADLHNPCYCDPRQPNKFCINPAMNGKPADLDCFGNTGFRPGPPEVGPCSVGVAPSPPVMGCYGFDAQQWDGIMVWARVAPGSPTSIRIRAADRMTSEKVCICNPYTNQNDSSDACDKAGQYIVVDSTFRPYLVPFAEMQQAGYGLIDPYLDTSRLISMGIEFRFGAWDLWIDDVAFYRRRK